MDVREELLKIQSNYKPTSWTVVLKGRKDLLNKLINLYGDKPLKELFYLGLNNGLTDSDICKEGNLKSFNGIKVGYTGFCKKHCICERSQTSKITKNRWKTLDNTIVQNKKRKTNLKKYGVTNILNNFTIKEKYLKKNIENYGFDNPLKNKEVQEKARNTLKEKYGVEYALQSSEIYSQLKKTNISKYGVEHPRTQNIEIKSKAEETNLKKYGAENPFASDVIKEKIIETNTKKFKRLNPNQRHWSEEVFQNLQSKEKFKSLCENYDYPEIINVLGIDHKTFLRYYHDEYNLTIYDFKLRSIYENEIKNFLIEHGVKFKTNDRTVLYPREIDFLIKDKNIGIEFNGIFYHCESYLNNIYYHYNKWLNAKEKNITLLQINEIDWNTRKDIWKNRIKAHLGLIQEKIDARKCEIKEIKNNESYRFLEKYHIQGGIYGINISLGCFYNDELVSVLCFKNNQGGVYELVRFCNNFSIVRGAFSKLMKYFEHKYKPKEIITFSDNSYSNGILYKKFGFEQIKILNPTYYYTDYRNLWHKYSFRKQKINKKFGLDITNKTEKELTKELGLHRYYDAGKIKWIKRY